MLTDPNDFELTFRADGKYPYRVLFKLFEYYFTNQVPKKFHFGPALVTQHGENWYKLRTIINPIVVKPSMVNLHTTNADQIALEFIGRIREVRDSKNETPEDFMTEINKWTIEVLANIAFDTRLNLFISELADEQTRAVRFVESIHKMIELSSDLEFSISPWEYFPTPTYRKFEKAVDTLLEYVNEF